MSNDQYIANTNKKIEKLCKVHKQTLLDYSSKHITKINVCAKEWIHRFEQNLNKIHNQYMEQVENVIFHFLIYHIILYFKFL